MRVTAETCRVCLGKHNLNPIFEKDLSEKIMFCASVQLSEDDNLPKMICNQCLFYLDIAYIFRTVCEATDVRLQKYLKERSDENKTVDNNEEVETPDEENFYFGNSPVANEVIIGEENKDIEISLQENHIPTKDADKSIDNISDNNKHKVGRHVAKKNSGKCPQRLPPQDIPNQNTKLDPTHTDSKPETIVVQPETVGTPDEVKPEDDKTLSEEKGRKTYQCDICNKFFPYKSHLVRHLSVHSGVKRYSCHHCNKKFINRYNLSVHMQKHTGKFPLSCKLCGRGFSSPSLLKRHSNSHTGSSKFQCRYCPKKMLYLSSLKLHEKMHVYRPSYTCDVCFKVFSYTNSLAEHKKVHQGLKEFVCGVCCKRFSRKTSLRRHMSTHAQTKKIKCKYCHLSFSGDNYRSHVKTHKKTECKKSLTCEECFKSFGTKALLIRHLKQHVGLSDC